MEIPLLCRHLHLFYIKIRCLFLPLLFTIVGYAFAFGTGNQNSTDWHSAVNKTTQMDVCIGIFIFNHIDNNNWWVFILNIFSFYKWLWITVEVESLCSPNIFIKLTTMCRQVVIGRVFVVALLKCDLSLIWHPVFAFIPQTSSYKVVINDLHIEIYL